MTDCYFDWLPVDLQEQILEGLKPHAINDTYLAGCISKVTYDKVMRLRHESQCQAKYLVIGNLQCPDYYMAYTILKTVLRNSSSGSSEGDVGDEGVQLYLLALLETVNLPRGDYMARLYRQGENHQRCTDRVVSKILNHSSLQQEIKDSTEILEWIAKEHPFHTEIIPALLRLKVSWQNILVILGHANNLYLLRGFLGGRGVGKTEMVDGLLGDILHNNPEPEPVVVLLMQYFEVPPLDLAKLALLINSEKLLRLALKSNDWLMAILRHSSLSPTLDLTMVRLLTEHLELRLSYMPKGVCIDEKHLLIIQNFCLPHWHLDPCIPEVFTRAVSLVESLRTLNCFSRPLPDEMLDLLIYKLELTPKQEGGVPIHVFFYGKAWTLRQPIKVLKRLLELRPRFFDNIELDVRRMDEAIWRESVMSDLLRLKYGMRFVRQYASSLPTMSLALTYDDLPWERHFKALYQSVAISYQEEVMALMRVSKHYPKEGIALPDDY